MFMYKKRKKWKVESEIYVAKSKINKKIKNRVLKISKSVMKIIWKNIKL